MSYFNKIVSYDKEKYDFEKLLLKLYNIELTQVHTILEKKQELFKDVGKDTHSDIHKIFYDKMRTGWPEFMDLYKQFIEEVVLPYLNLDEALYQTWPTFRVQLPNNLAVVIKHHDSDELHKHPNGEINFVLAITEMYETSTIWFESEPRCQDFKPMNLKKNTLFCFNGNKCDHFNKINITGKSRISFDFRILPIDKISRNSKKSVTTNIKFTEGEYYTRLKLNKNNEKNSYIAKDIWDREKEKFNKIMKKYNVNDAWGVVDIFEKKIAKYAGSKYAVSVDNCTNALFLCLKYLKATGYISLPSKTWISVPCAVIHSGCKVKFEDYEWSGMYQLKPYPIYDGAVRMKKGMYKSDTFHCLSFHIRKHLPIGKGGMILTNDKEAYNWFRTVRYEGRNISDDGINYVPYKEDKIKSLGWNMYMTPEQSARGLELFEKIEDNNPDQESSGTCKNLEELGIYQDKDIYYSYDYWFNNSEHDNWHQGGDNYYVNTFYENIIMKLDDIPKEGKILVLGTHNCVSFDKLCKYFGYDRCIGYDLYNPTNHPNVVIKDCMKLGDEKIDIAFCHNDLGNYATTPKLKEIGQIWAAKNIIKGGYMLSNNNFNRAKVKNIEIMTENGFEITQLIDLQDKYNLKELAEREFARIEGYMISKKL